MEELTIEKLKKQHIENYKNSIMETIKNNTKVLVNEDIKLLIAKPPLDSMDSVKSKFLSLAKKNKIILNTEELSKILDNYRKDLSKCLFVIEEERTKYLISIINKFKFGTAVFVFYKKDFISVNKKIKAIIKEQLEESCNNMIFKGINKVFDNNVSDDIKELFKKDISKYLNSNYKKQILDSFDIKVLVKDTILINAVKEAADRYIFTLENSKILNLD
ncbi:MAG: hypothetical protein IJ097_00575 [Bacilli bacterium]|nr:hypothetical protein [Bacilli bacterium]